MSCAIVELNSPKEFVNAIHNLDLHISGLLTSNISGRGSLLSKDTNYAKSSDGSCRTN